MVPVDISKWKFKMYASLEFHGSVFCCKAKAANPLGFSSLGTPCSYLVEILLHFCRDNVHSGVLCVLDKGLDWGGKGAWSQAAPCSPGPGPWQGADSFYSGQRHHLFERWIPFGLHFGCTFQETQKLHIQTSCGTSLLLALPPQEPHTVHPLPTNHMRRTIFSKQGQFSKALFFSCCLPQLPAPSLLRI